MAGKVLKSSLNKKSRKWSATIVAKGIINIIENYYCDTVGTIYISLCLFGWLPASYQLLENSNKLEGDEDSDRRGSTIATPHTL